MNKLTIPLSIISTLLMHLGLIIQLKLLDSFGLIISLIIFTMIIGLSIRKIANNQIFTQIGKGLFCGGLISAALLTGFMFWLSSNWPK